MRFAPGFLDFVACRYTNYMFMHVKHLSQVHADVGDCQMDSQEITLRHCALKYSAYLFFALANS
jgi:hypothetical protein